MASRDVQQRRGGRGARGARARSLAWSIGGSVSGVGRRPRQLFAGTSQLLSGVSVSASPPRALGAPATFISHHVGQRRCDRIAVVICSSTSLWAWVFGGEFFAVILERCGRNSSACS